MKQISPSPALNGQVPITHGYRYLESIENWGFLRVEAAQILLLIYYVFNTSTLLLNSKILMNYEICIYN